MDGVIASLDLSNFFGLGMYLAGSVWVERRGEGKGGG